MDSTDPTDHTADPLGGGPTDRLGPVVDPRESRRAARKGRHQLLREAAIQAELATGVHEETEEAARRHILIRLATIAVGFVVFIGGLIMLALPGPGLLTVVAGLAILAQELTWAERLLEYVKKRSKIDGLKRQPAWVQALMWTVTASAVVGSAVYFLVLP